MKEAETKQWTQDGVQGDIVPIIINVFADRTQDEPSPREGSFEM